MQRNSGVYGGRKRVLTLVAPAPVPARVPAPHRRGGRCCPPNTDVSKDGGSSAPTAASEEEEEEPVSDSVDENNDAEEEGDGDGEGEGEAEEDEAEFPMGSRLSRSTLTAKTCPHRAPPPLLPARYLQPRARRPP